MFFDGYAIHIQAFLDFINGKFIIVRSSSPQNYLKTDILENREKQTKTHGT